MTFCWACKRAAPIYDARRLYSAERFSRQAVGGGLVGILAAAVLIRLLTHAQLAIGIPGDMSVKLPTLALSVLVAAGVGVLSGYIQAYSASRKNIVDGLRHIG